MTIRKLLFSCFIAFLLGQVGFAQSNFRIIPRIGANQVIYTDDLNDYDFKERGGIQVGVDLKFGQELYVLTGLAYVHRNSFITSVLNNTGINTESEYDLKSLRVPLYFGYDFWSAERLGLRIFGGPNIHFFIDPDDFEFTVNEWRNKDIQWGLNAGVGVDLGIISFDLTHEWNLSSVLEVNGMEAGPNTLYLSAGILF